MLRYLTTRILYSSGKECPKTGLKGNSVFTMIDDAFVSRNRLEKNCYYNAIRGRWTHNVIQKHERFKALASSESTLSTKQNSAVSDDKRVRRNSI